MLVLLMDPTVRTEVAMKMKMHLAQIRKFEGHNIGGTSEYPVKEPL